MHAMTLVRSGVCFALLGLLALSLPAAGQAVPDGFELQQIVKPPFSASPAAFAFLPDGRIVVLERYDHGSVRIAPVTSTPPTTSDSIFSLPGVTGLGEEGAVGVAVDPDWPDRPYLYFYYTHTGGVCYLVMYRASGDLSDPSSTNITLHDPFFLFDDIPDQSTHHVSGTLRFGPDGMLYVSIGENQVRCEAQDRTTILGTILRLDVSALPDTGSGPPPKSLMTPADNPFPGPDEDERLVFAYGFRNPFRYTIDPATNNLYIGDVANLAWEELDEIVYAEYGGANYGWPLFEGYDSSSTNDTCGQGNTFTDPIFVYPHPAGASAVVGGPLYRRNEASSLSFPASYDGDYFFADFYDGAIRRLKKDGGGWAIAPMVAGQPDAANWATGLPYMSDFQLGPDGAVYFCILAGGQTRGIHRISWNAPTGVAGSTSPPSGFAVRVVPQPATVASGATIFFRRGAPSEASIGIYDVRGRLVRELRDGSGSGSVHWDGRQGDGHAVSTSVYFFRVEGTSGPGATGRISLVR